MEQELIDKLRKIASDFGNHYLWTLNEIIQEYHHLSINDAQSESRSIGNNEAKVEFCKYPSGYDKCHYKSKDYLTCKLLRKCPFAK